MLPLEVFALIINEIIVRVTPAPNVTSLLRNALCWNVNYPLRMAGT
jgi:hypothetical protein